MGAHFGALDEGVLLVPLDPKYTQVGFNLDCSSVDPGVLLEQALEVVVISFTHVPP